VYYSPCIASIDSIFQKTETSFRLIAKRNTKIEVAYIKSQKKNTRNLKSHQNRIIPTSHSAQSTTAIDTKQIADSN